MVEYPCVDSVAMAGSAAAFHTSGRQNCDVKMVSERGMQVGNGDLRLTARDWPAIGPRIVYATCHLLPLGTYCSLLPKKVSWAVTLFSLHLLTFSQCIGQTDAHYL